MVAIPHFLVVGLGNSPYPMTRHSVGHVILDSLAARFRVQFRMDKTLRGFVARTRMPVSDGEVDLTLYKPKALMNITGPCVSAALKGTGIPPTSMIVIHDSLDRKPCTVLPKFSGSASGHNGIRSVIAALGNNKDFHRLRVGIGRGEGSDVAGYVLSAMSPEEREFWSVDGQGTDLVLNELTKITTKP